MSIFCEEQVKQKIKAMHWEEKKNNNNNIEQHVVGGKSVWGNLEKHFNSFLIKNELVHPNKHSI